MTLTQPPDDNTPSLLTAHSARPQSNGSPGIQFIPMHALLSEDRTRLAVNEAHVQALLDDILQRLRDHPDRHPVHTPLRVIQRGNKYPIVAGHHRYCAGLRVPLKDMPCILLSDDLDPASFLIEQARDNELHQGYTRIERARNILRVVELRSCSQAEAGRLLGIKNPADVAKDLGVLRYFPQDLHGLIGEGDGKVPFTSAYKMTLLHPDEQKIRELTDRVVRGLLKRDRVEEEVDRILGNGKRQKKAKPVKWKGSGASAITPGDWTGERILAWFTEQVEKAKRG